MVAVGDKFELEGIICEIISHVGIDSYGSRSFVVKVFQEGNDGKFIYDIAEYEMLAKSKKLN